MLKENGEKLILQQSLYATGHQGISWSIFLLVQDIILALRWVFAWYSVISSGDYEGDISLSELTVCWKLELLGSHEITAEVEVMLAAWR